MPPAKPDNGKKPFALTNGDAIAFLNVSGQPGRHELMVKDRYTHFWVYDQQLAPLWQGQGQTGHYPYPFDIDGDGRDELAIGYALWDHRGQQLWSRDAELDGTEGAEGARPPAPAPALAHTELTCCQTPARSARCPQRSGT